MMISVKKVFISSNSKIIYLSCPLPCGHFLIQESTVDGLSYYIKKERNKYALLSYRHLDVIIFGEGMWESNPPRTLLTPNTSFED